MLAFKARSLRWMRGVLPMRRAERLIHAMPTEGRGSHLRGCSPIQCNSPAHLVVCGRSDGEYPGAQWGRPSQSVVCQLPSIVPPSRRRRQKTIACATTDNGHSVCRTTLVSPRSNHGWLTASGLPPVDTGRESSPASDPVRLIDIAIARGLTSALIP